MRVNRVWTPTWGRAGSKGPPVAGEMSVWMTYAATQCHGNIQPWNADKDHGPTGVCVEVQPRSHR